MKTIKLNLWTSNLGHVKVTPIDNENSEVMDLLNNANGDYDLNIVDEVEEMSQLGYVECYLADPSLASSVTVIDENGTETEYESYLEENDVVDSYDLINAAEQNDVKVVGEDGPVPERLLERIKAGDEIIRNNGLIRSHLESLINDPNAVCMLSYGDIGNGVVKFDIELEDDEEFDINKLRFIDESCWWDDADIADIDGLCETFENHSVLLDFIVYDDKIVTRSDASFVSGYEQPGNVVLSHSDMSPAEL